MCAIVGWNVKLDWGTVKYILDQARKRGRDGWGFWADGIELRGRGEIPGHIMEDIVSAKNVVGNFRATPTTEAESKIDNLQPYGGIVHNGTIANDKEFGDYEIDTMVLPDIFKGVDSLWTFKTALKKVLGSFALAFFRGDSLFIAANYKPIYWSRDDDGVIFASQSYMLPFDSIPFKPYSLVEVAKEFIVFDEIDREQNKKVVVSCSGGLDSVTVAYMLKKEGYDVSLAYFKYSCLAEDRELNRVTNIAEHGGFELIVIEMPKGVMKGTIVEGKFDTGKSGITGAEYAVDWVSARNLLMLSMLTAYAESNKIGYIAFGGNLEESGAYPDNEEEFGNRFNSILPYATQNGVKIELLQPVAHLMKHEIVKKGLSLGVPYELTWSCYSDKDEHCGKCAPCFMRKTAFERNKEKDPVML
tara:strand:- start:57 stop:1301 length:1245 start_codon:yes stop_codon:yes gene_type:complete